MLLVAHCSYAALTIDITRGNNDPLPIALPYPENANIFAGNMGKKIIDVVEKDLESTALFTSISRKAFIQSVISSKNLPKFSDWRQINSSALIASNVDFIEDNKFETEFRLWDILSEKQIAGKLYTTNDENWRRIAHLIADEVYSRITGEDGYFDSRIVYIAEYGPVTRRIKRLAVMDQDGANHRYLTDGKDLVLTPRFSPNTQKIIYMSYANNRPKVYIRDIDSGAVELVGNFPGMSFAPRFSPDGKSVIMSVSIDGNSEIYAMDLKSKKHQRLTNNPAIDTSPSFSPDGKRIVFNSDRGGSQQLYTMDADGKNVKRISFSKKGRYGTPVWSPRGDLIAFTKMYRGLFYIGVMKTDGSGERLLTQSFLDEGPTWSPNGRVIIFARQTPYLHNKQGSWKIHSIDLTGYNEKMLPTPKDASDPAWSPLL